MNSTIHQTSTKVLVCSIPCIGDIGFLKAPTLTHTYIYISPLEPIIIIHIHPLLKATTVQKEESYFYKARLYFNYKKNKLKAIIDAISIHSKLYQ